MGSDESLALKVTGLHQIPCGPILLSFLPIGDYFLKTKLRSRT